MSEQDVNAQHMRAMGLGEVKLGERYAASDLNFGRCEALLDHRLRCARPDGHDGNHARGGATWPQVEAESLQFFHETTRETLIDEVARAFHPMPDGEDIATAEIAVDKVLEILRADLGSALDV